MPVLSEGNTLGDLLKYEAPQLYSRDLLTVADGQDLALGVVIGINSADGKVYVLDPVAADGTETAIGIMIRAAAPVGADEAVPVIVRHAIVADHALIWPAGITDQQKTDALAALKASGILVRKGV